MGSARVSVSVRRTVMYRGSTANRYRAGRTVEARLGFALVTAIGNDVDAPNCRKKSGSVVDGFQACIDVCPVPECTM